jgi:DNA end-binding protein Ku
MATSVWTGTISFGLVSIPVKLFSATASHDISFNLLHADCKGRINLQNYCPQCERVVERSELVKGYQYEKEQYAIVSEEDIKTVKPESSSILDIIRFTDVGKVDPIYYDKTYYVGPDKGSEKPFALLAQAMEETKRAAIGKMVMRNHEYLVLVRPAMEGLVAHFMLYKDEIRENENKVNRDLELRSKELDLAVQLVENLSEAFDPDDYKDDYVVKLEEMLEAKIHGRKLTVVKPSAKPKVVDLMEALQKSVQMSKRPAARADQENRKLKKAR